MSKDEEWSGLLKVPDEIIIKQLREDIKELKIAAGQSQAYIDELEYKIQQLKEEEIKNKQVVALEKSNVQLRLKLADKENRIVDLTQKTERLQKELLQFFKTKNQ